MTKEFDIEKMLKETQKVIDDDVVAIFEITKKGKIIFREVRRKWL